MAIKHIFFDNDGVIVDSEILAIENMVSFLRTFGYADSLEQYAKRFPGLLEKDILRIICGELGIAVPEGMHEQIKEGSRKILAERLQTVKGMPALVRRLQIPKSFVSNGSLRHVHFSLGRARLRQRVDGRIFSAEMVARPKPFPDLYQLALATFQLDPSEVLVVEDSPTGVEAAKSAGLTTVGFLGGSHIFDGHSEILIGKGADQLAAHAKDLEKIFLEFGIPLR